MGVRFMSLYVCECAREIRRTGGWGGGDIMCLMRANIKWMTIAACSYVH